MIRDPRDDEVEMSQSCDVYVRIIDDAPVDGEDLVCCLLLLCVKEGTVCAVATKLNDYTEDCLLLTV